MVLGGSVAAGGQRAHMKGTRCQSTSVLLLRLAQVCPTVFLLRIEGASSLLLAPSAATLPGYTDKRGGGRVSTRAWCTLAGGSRAYV
jgi:hypothetical protein